jgi:type IV pilus assembly protein PilW
MMWSSSYSAAASGARVDRGFVLRVGRGFVLVEMLIAILIALFLVGGLLTLVQAMKRTASVQTGLSQLQDNERVAMTLIADVIESAGYYPNPTVNTAASSFPIVAPFTIAGQSLVGTGSWTDPAPGNSISVRYSTAGTAAGDNTINCTGNPSVAATSFTNTFSVDPATGSLICVLNGGAPVSLVGGVSNLQIYYGVQTNPGVSNNSADTYLDATAVTAGNYWSQVVSVKITVTFANPLYGTLAGQSLNVPQTIPFTRVIDVMNKTGVST